MIDTLNYFVLLVLTFKIYLVYTTIDVNFPELEYIADHLELDECRKLIASLHFQSYEMPPNLDIAEHKIPIDASCSQLLIKWNSNRGEGFGKTHEVLQHRLRQIGRQDLAVWLGKTVYQELGKELEQNLNEPFAEVLNTASVTEGEELNIDKKSVDPDDINPWLPFDTIAWTIAFILFILTLFVIGKSIHLFCPCQRVIQKTKRKSDYEYQEIGKTDISINSDSENELYRSSTHSK